MSEAEKAIGLLDSGLGGLSVYREFKKQLPHEQIIYFGDTAHIPYGEKSNNQILGYVNPIIKFLLQQDVKLIVIACNTISAVALDKFKKKLDIPIIGVILPGTEDAIKKTRNKKIGIVGTEVTIRNKSYEKAIKEQDHTIITYSNACSNQIIREMEEQALKDVDRIRVLLKECIDPLIKKGIDTMVWGCTHYPFLSKYVEKEINPEIVLVDPSEATVKKVKELLCSHNKINSTIRDKKDTFFISGNVELFVSITQKLLSNVNGTFLKAPTILSSEFLSDYNQN